jgi:cobalt-zinc-cadmium efflux system outer membrane protein
MGDLPSFSKTIAVAGLLALAGCATPDPNAAFSDFGATVQDRLPERVMWRTGGPEDAAVDARVAEILAGPLTADTAVAVALLNNRSIQALYTEIGIAQADIVEAGLLHNPMFEVMVRPSTEEGTNLEFGLVQNFLDLLMRPAKRKVAEAEYEAVKLEVAAELVAFAAEVKEAYFEHLGAQNVKDAYAEIASTAKDAADLAAAFHKAGNFSDLELAEHQADAEEAALKLIDAEREMTESEIHLVEILGLSAGAEWSMPRRVPSVPDVALVFDGLEDRALRDRFDVQSLRAEVRAAAEDLGLTEDFRLIDEAELGVSAEREPEGEWLIGPGLEIPLPIFDQGQTKVTQATMRLRAAQDSLLAHEQSVRAEVRRAQVSMTANRAKAIRIRETVLPLKEQITGLTLKEYNYMLTGAFEVIEAEQHQNETYLEYLEALTKYWIARAALQAAVGGHLPSPQNAQLTGDAS